MGCRVDCVCVGCCSTDVVVAAPAGPKTDVSAVACDGSVLFVARENKSLTAVNLEDGRELFKKSLSKRATQLK